MNVHARRVRPQLFAEESQFASDVLAGLSVRPKRLPLVGYLSDERERPLAGARASIAGKTATTGPDGRFEMMLPADLPEGDRTITITAQGYETWRGQAVPGGNALQLRLPAARKE